MENALPPNYTGIVVYLDTVIVHFPAAANDLSLRQRVHRYRGCKWIEDHRIERVGNGMIEVKLHRPSAPMLAKIAEWIGTAKCEFRGVDIASDLLVADGESLHSLRAWVDRHLVQRNRRHDVKVKLIGRSYKRGDGERTTDTEPTRYLQRSDAGRNTAIYSDRPSKLTGQPCVHIETRVRGLQALRRFKLVHNLPRLADPIERLKIWNRVVRFASWDLEKIGRDIIDTQAQVVDKTVDLAKSRRIAGLHARLVMYELGEHEITATVVSAMCNKLGLRTARLMPTIGLYTPVPTSTQTHSSTKINDGRIN